MNSKQAILILFILIVGIAVLSSTVEATRVLKEDFATANHLVRLPSNYDQTKLTMTSLLGRLVSGPSQGGKGH
ncbi:hypothetical protein MKX03_008769 [Papaver bracteatum]|nr:hypothetical protein MKX03_008769 [Papaver bracteatum]